MQENLARQLRVLRAQRGLSLTEAAEAIGVTRDTLSEIERGKRHPYTPTLAKIARGYGVPVEDLLEEPVALAGKAEARETGQPETLIDRPEVQEWLAEHGHRSREGLRQWLEEGLDPGLDENGWPRGLERAVHELRTERDYLKDEASRGAGALFGRGLGASKEVWRLKNELNHEYLQRVVDVVAYSKHLYAIGESGGYLSFTRERDADVEEARRQTLGEEAYQPGEFMVVVAA